MNNQPSAKQKKWREAVRSLGSVISGAPAVIHHPVGRTGKHNKIHIGHWWVIPLTDEEHRALHSGGRPWGDQWTRKEFERWAFLDVCIRVPADDHVIPADVIDAVADYHR